jgi:hypothetical protein
VAGAPVGEIDATLLTFKIRSDRPLWSEQFLEPAVSGRPPADANAGDLDDRNGPLCGHRAWRLELLQCSEGGSSSP